MSSNDWDQLDYLTRNESAVTPIDTTAPNPFRNLFSFDGDNDDDDGEHDPLVLCHVPMFLPFSQANSPQDGRNRLNFGLSISSGALLAINHWNNGNGVIVKDIKDLHQTCPIRFTTEIFDTARLTRKAMDEFVDLTSRAPGDDQFIKPCAIIASMFSAPFNTKFPVLTGVYDVMQVSPVSSSTQLEDGIRYPLFARTIPSAAASAAQAVDYLHQLGVRRFAVVYDDNDSGPDYQNIATDRSADLNMQSPLAVPVTLTDLTMETVKEAMKVIREERINYIIGAFFSASDQFDTIMEAAYEIGIAGPDNLWLFCDTMRFSSYFNSKSYPIGSTFVKAVEGNAIMVDRGGMPGVPKYDAIVNEWKKLGESFEALNYITSKHRPRVNGNFTKKEYRDVLRQIFEQSPPHHAIYSYEAIVAIGISACKQIPGTLESGSLFTSMDHHEQLLDIDFESASGRVTIAPGTISRDNSDVVYSMANILQKPTTISTNITLHAIEKLYLDVNQGKWVRFPEASEFIYPGGSTNRPQEYVPTFLERFNEFFVSNRTTIMWLVPNLIFIACVYCWYRKVRKSRIPTVRVVATRNIPDLTLPADCNEHMFFSHVWKTGQAPTHAIVRNLQRYLPGIQIWLDVDELDNINDLEASVKASVVFVLYYSKGYFASKNCRREIYAAFELNKPIILLYEGDEKLTLDALKEECTGHCFGTDDATSSETILNYLFADDSIDNCILWLREGGFSAAALSRIYFILLKHLPYYQRSTSHLELKDGIAVPHEQLHVVLHEPINIVINSNHRGNQDVALELQSFASTSGEEDYITIKDMQEILHPSEDEAMEINVLQPTTTFHQSTIHGNPSFFLLYLNEDTFNFQSNQEREDFVTFIKSCVESGIKIVLVHEQDIEKGSCRISTLYANAPDDLLCPPINLFQEIAIPLHVHEKYREVSFRIILTKMGGKPKKSSKKWKIVQDMNTSSVIRRRSRGIKRYLKRL